MQTYYFFFGKMKYIDTNNCIDKKESVLLQKTN